LKTVAFTPEAEADAEAEAEAEPDAEAEAEVEGGVLTTLVLLWQR
jgi:hypothetical protein